MVAKVAGRCKPQVCSLADKVPGTQKFWAKNMVAKGAGGHCLQVHSPAEEVPGSQGFWPVDKDAGRH